MNAEYTLLVFVFGFGCCGANPNSDCVAEGGGVLRCRSRFFTFNGAVWDDTLDGIEGRGGGGMLESAR